MKFEDFGLKMGARRISGSSAMFLVLLALFVLLSEASISHIDSLFHKRNPRRHDQTEEYIVYLGDVPDHMQGDDPYSQSIVDTHLNLLSAAYHTQDEAGDNMLHCFTRSFNAFVAKLTPEQASDLGELDEVVSIFKNEKRQLHTTRSWDFLGLPINAKRNPQGESDVIIGLLDTGIIPDSESFNDKGMGPPPKKWKGSCGPYKNFTCNNKVIGGKYFHVLSDPIEDESPSPADYEGHGTHTASSAAGSLVEHASLYGLAEGTARGAVPSARLAMYKVCWVDSGCADADILAGFDAAIADGVDLISISIGGSSPQFLSDAIAIGSYHAMKKGILTVASGGNDGPTAGTVENYSPWILTVAATGMDRRIATQITLGNGMNITGMGINTEIPPLAPYPLATGGQVADMTHGGVETGKYCSEDSLDAEKAKEKIVYCMMMERGCDTVVKTAGGSGVIIQKETLLDVSEPYIIPGVAVTKNEGAIISRYIATNRHPTAVIHKSIQVSAHAPFIASFSSRGPGPDAMNIVKPDIAAPGVNILAAYTPYTTLSGQADDTRFVKYNFMSGTSMACPHVAGTAAYIKSFNPTWSPAMIKSAIMTTATPMNSRRTPDGEFAYGAGQVNPSKAIDPGLVYDEEEASYISFLCHEKIQVNISAFTTNKTDCSKFPAPESYDGLNYPSFQGTTDAKGTPLVFKRTVTNVGPANSVYESDVVMPPDVHVTVSPSILRFTRPNEKQLFSMTVTATHSDSVYRRSGTLTWVSPTHSVRSPIVVL